MTFLAKFPRFWGLAFGLLACGHTALGSHSVPGQTEEGLAAYYSDQLHGRKTASGEPYDKNRLTGAHRELPFGTIVRVINLKNRQMVDIRITDLGPFADHQRIIDLSRMAAKRIGMIRDGVVPVRLEIVSMPK